MTQDELDDMTLDDLRDRLDEYKKKQRYYLNTYSGSELQIIQNRITKLRVEINRREKVDNASS